MRSLDRKSPTSAVLERLGLTDVRSHLDHGFLYFELFSDQCRSVSKLLNHAGNPFRALPAVKRGLLTGAQLSTLPISRALGEFVDHQRLDLLGGCPPHGMWSEAFRPENQKNRRGLRRSRHGQQTARLFLSVAMRQQKGSAAGGWGLAGIAAFGTGDRPSSSSGSRMYRWQIWIVA